MTNSLEPQGRTRGHAPEDLRSAMCGATLFIIDGDAAARRRMRLLGESAGMNVESFDSAEEFRQQHDPSRMGCLVLDFCLPGMTGLQLLEELKAEGMGIPAIVISGHADVSAAVKAIKCGAVEVFQRPYSEVALLESIRKALSDFRRKQQLQREIHAFELLLGRLSERENQIVDRVVQGLATKQIAAELQVSVKTIEACRTHIMSVLGVGNAAELAAKVARVKFRREWNRAA